MCFHECEGRDLAHNQAGSRPSLQLRVARMRHAEYPLDPIGECEKNIPIKVIGRRSGGPVTTARLPAEPGCQGKESCEGKRGEMEDALLIWIHVRRRGSGGCLIDASGRRAVGKVGVSWGRGSVIDRLAAGYAMQYIGRGGDST